MKTKTRDKLAGMAVFAGFGLLMALPLGLLANAEQPVDTENARPDKPRSERPKADGRNRQRDGRPAHPCHEQTVQLRETHRKAMQELHGAFFDGLKEKTPQEACQMLAERKSKAFEAHRTFLQQMHQHRQNCREQELQKHSDDDAAGGKASGEDRSAEMEARFNTMLQDQEQRHQEFLKGLNALSAKEDLTHADLMEYVRESRRNAKSGDGKGRPPRQQRRDGDNPAGRPDRPAKP